jgi:hypothetical protein
MFQTNARESVAAKTAVGGVRGGKVGPGQLFTDEAIDFKRLAGEGTANLYTSVRLRPAPTTPYEAALEKAALAIATVGSLERDQDHLECSITSIY